MKLRLSALILFLAAVCTPHAFADERFDSLRELLSNPDNYRDYEPSADIQSAGKQREPQHDRASQRGASGSLDERKQESGMTLNEPMLRAVTMR